MQFRLQSVPASCPCIGRVMHALVFFLRYSFCYKYSVFNFLYLQKWNVIFSLFSVWEKDQMGSVHLFLHPVIIISRIASSCSVVVSFNVRWWWALLKNDDWQEYHVIWTVFRILLYFHWCRGTEIHGAWCVELGINEGSVRLMTWRTLLKFLVWQLWIGHAAHSVVRLTAL